MGYARTNIIIYGVKISDELANKIFNKYFSEDTEYIEFSQDDLIYYRKQSEDCSNKGLIQLTPISPYKQHDDGTYGSPALFPTMLSEKTDSRIHSLLYDKGFDHVIGIQIASNGYAYEDDIEYFMKNIPKEVISEFNNTIMTVLEEYNINASPQIHLVTQTR